MLFSLQKYATHRDNPAILLYPGWTHLVEREPKLLQKLSKHYTCYTVHLPGYGKVPDITREYSFEEIICEIRKTLYKNSVELVGIIGFSMGCRMVAEHCRQSKKDIPSVYIGCPFSIAVPFWGTLLLAHEWIRVVAQGIPSLQRIAINAAAQSVSENKNVRYVSTDVTNSGAYFSLLAMLESSPPISHKRSLFIYGEHDPYRQQLPDSWESACIEIIGAPHNCVMNYELKVTNEIKNFLTSATSAKYN